METPLLISSFGNGRAPHFGVRFSFGRFDVVSGMRKSPAFLIALSILIALPSCAEVATNDTETFPERNSGERLFQNKCKSCHEIKVAQTGPALEGATNRHDREWLRKFIRDSQGMVQAGDSAAQALYKEWGQVIMTSFPELTDSEIDSILKYIEYSSGPLPDQMP